MDSDFYISRYNEASTKPQSYLNEVLVSIPYAHGGQSLFMQEDFWQNLGRYGRYFITGAMDNTARIVDSHSGKEVAQSNRNSC